MSRSASNIVDSVFPGLGWSSSSAVKSVMPQIPQVPEPPARGATDVENKTQDIAQREQEHKRASRAAGLTLLEDEGAASLGSPPRRAASRTLLGGR